MLFLHLIAHVILQVPHEGPGKVIQVKCSWSNTANTIQAISMDEDDDSALDSIDDAEHAQVHCLLPLLVPSKGSAQALVPQQQPACCELVADCIILFDAAGMFTSCIVRGRC